MNTFLIELTHWEVSADKTKFTQLMLKVGYSLSEAKSTVDKLLNGELLKIKSDTIKQPIPEFIDELEQLNIRYQIDTAHPKAAYVRGWKDALKVLEGHRNAYVNPEKQTWSTLGYRDGLQYRDAQKTQIEYFWEQHIAKISKELGIYILPHKSSGQVIADIFQEIADSGGLGIRDPVTWQQEVRQERSLPFRNN
ncbi:MAG: hypothetical protein SVR94_00955 [Pseudomonadota bacterium]|nr:hypothetical protein [Pseudomonadota bacterium]